MKINQLQALLFKIANVAGLSVFIWTPYAHADFGVTPKKGEAPFKPPAISTSILPPPVIKAAPPPPPSQVMSSDTFKSTAGQMGQDTQAGLKQQVNQEIAKQPPIPPQPDPSKEPASGSAQDETTSEDGTISSKKTQQKATSQTPAKSRLANPLPGTDKQNSGYTGFNSAKPSNNGQSKSSGSGDKSSGWNIQY
jgi:hypothetical protein